MDSSRATGNPYNRLTFARDPKFPARVRNFNLFRQMDVNMMIYVFLWLLAGYWLAGVIFAIPFIFIGVGKVDSHARRGSWGFRLLIFPGVTALWPLLAWRWFTKVSNPPRECNAHRRAVGTSSP